MKNILIITGRYLPGYKDGGPVRTIKNLTDQLGEDFHFTIMCADRDHGDDRPYDGIKINDVNRVGKADVYYVGEGKYSFKVIKELAEKNDVVYVCGPYNDYAIKSLLLKRFKKIKCPLILAPMGSFSKGALAIKSTKKQIFLTLFKILGLFDDISFSVTSEVEKRELKEAMGLTNKCYVAEDPQRAIDDSLIHTEYKKDGVLGVVFLSRISEKKNLLGAVNILSKVKGSVNFSIYGNIEDEAYYEKCVEKLKALPNNIKWEYKGIADSEKVPEILSQYDVFLFPTHGENFGHVISEALLAGTIPVISDTTPWLDFDENIVGFVISHENYDEFSKCIDKLFSMETKELKEISDNAKAYYERKYNGAKEGSSYREMFNEVN